MFKMITTWQAFALGSAFFAALTAIFGKLGVAKIDSNLATFIRTVIILLLIAAILTFKSGWQKPQNIPTKDIVFLVLSALATGLSWLCYYRALQMAPASKVAPIDKLSVAFAVVLALVFLGETLTWQVALGATLVTAGAVVMVL